MAAKLHHVLAIRVVDDSSLTQRAVQFGWRMSVIYAHHGADLVEAFAAEHLSKIRSGQTTARQLRREVVRAWGQHLRSDNGGRGHPQIAG